MALFFATGAMCFFVGPFPGYAGLVGDAGDSVTFFVGSILFTAGGAIQTGLSFHARRVPGAGRAAWLAAIIQSVGTLCFNVTTFRAMQTALSSPEYNRLVWRPDALGSVCFLVSGVIAFRACERKGWLPKRGAAGWWEPLREPARLRLLRCRRSRRPRRSIDRHAARSGGRQLEHLSRSGVLPGLRCGDAAHRSHAQVAATAAPAQAGARRGATGVTLIRSSSPASPTRRPARLRCVCGCGYGAGKRTGRRSRSS
jgi:hypothetical protein